MSNHFENVALSWYARAPTAPERGDVRVLDDARAAALERLCELLVPGSSRVGPAVYVDALLERMDAEQRGAALAAIESLAELDAATLAGRAGAPEFLQVRALAIEAFYSDFVAPGCEAEGAWAEIDFSTPLATRLAKDWSYLGVQG